MPSGLLKDYIGQGEIAFRPTTPDPSPGTAVFWYATDTEVLSTWNEDTAAWEDVGGGSLPPGLAGGSTGEVLTKLSGTDYDFDWQTGGGGGGGANWWFQPPAAADFSLASGDATNVTLTDDSDCGLVVASGAIVSGNKIRYAYKTIPAPGSAWSVTTKLQITPNQSYLAGSGAGLCCVDSVTGQSYSVQTILDGNNTQGRQGTIAGSISFNRGLYTQLDMFVRLARVGSNIDLSISYDGKNFAIADRIGISGHFSTQPNRVGPCCVLNGGTEPVFVTVPYWAQSF